MLVGMMVFAIVGCASTKSEMATVPSATQTPSNQPQDSMAQVAAILGISQQKLEDAFTQARSEMQANMPENTQPPSVPQNAAPPAGTPPTGMTAGPGLPSDLLAKVAEILGIDQQTLEDAFAKVQSEMPSGAAPPSPNQ